MTNFLAVARVMLGLLPVLIDAVKALEKAFPEKGQGSEKLAVIAGALQAAYNVAEEALPAWETMWRAISGAVDVIVAVFNKTGKFPG